MLQVTLEYALEVKAVSEAAIQQHAGEILPVLPYLERTGVRSNTDLIGRALALNAIIDLNFKVPQLTIQNWIDKHGVASYLTSHEASLLTRDEQDIDPQEKRNLGWALDALWALMWAGQLVDDFDFTKPIPNIMYALCPHVQEDEGPEKFTKMKIRSFDELYRSLDLYYRLHWFAREYRIEDELGTFDLSRFVERRTALEWLWTPNRGWDQVSLNT